MKHIDTWLNEEEYKQFIKRVRELEKTPYSVVKKLVKDFLNNSNGNQKIMQILFWTISYAMLATTYILVF